MRYFNFVIAIRNLRRNKVFSAVNITGLALGMACCLVIAIYVWNEWNYDSFHHNANQVYRLTEKQNQGGKLFNVAVTPGPLAAALQKDLPEIQHTVRFGNWSGNLKINGHSYEEKNIQLTDNSIFSVFDFPLLKGNAGKALQSATDIVITESAAIKYFGNNWQSQPNLLGQILRLNNETDFTLAGIVKDPPANSSIQFTILLPLAWLIQTDEFSNKWNSNNYHTYVQLKPGTNADAFGKKVLNLLHRYNPDTQDQLLLQPLKKQYLYSAFDFFTDWGKRSNIKYIQIFTGVGILLLLIACVNFVNLSTARSLKRSVEVGIRKVNGASRRQLIAQFLSESLLMAFIAGILAVCLIIGAKPLLNYFLGTGFKPGIAEPVFIAFFLLFILLIGCIAGLYPAFVLSAFNPAKVLKKTSAVHSGKLFRQALVVVQFTISVTLITCTFFMHRQLKFIQDKDLGFDKEQLLSVSLGGQLREKSGLFRQELERIPGVVAAAPATMSLVNVDNSSYIEWEGMQKEDKFLITQANIDPAFIPALGIQTVSGHNFSRQLTNDTATYIVNESAVKRMGYTNENAIGRQLNFWGTKGRITGVVKDFHFKPLTAGIDPFIFRYRPLEPYFRIFVKIAPGRTQQVIQQMQQVYKKYETDVPFEFIFVNDAIRKLYSNDERTANIILLFAYLTIFVGCLGLFGLSVFSAEQRIKEIGIRKVLGAGLASITGLLSADFLKLVIVAIFLAVPAAWYITHQWLENYAYRIPVDWPVFALVALLVTGIAFITISFQCVKAAMANPVKSLRSE